MTDNESNTRAFYTAQIEIDPNVIATWTDAEGNTVVMVLDDSPRALASYATRVVGVTFVKGDEFVAFANNDRMRPAYPGVSSGHSAITAGTLGLVVSH